MLDDLVRTADKTGFGITSQLVLQQGRSILSLISAALVETNQHRHSR